MEELKRLLGDARAAADRAITREEQDREQTEQAGRELRDRVHREQLAAVEAAAEERVAAAESQARLQQAVSALDADERAAAAESNAELAAIIAAAEVEAARQLGEAEAKRVRQEGEHRLQAVRQAHGAQLVEVSANAAAKGAREALEAQKTKPGPLLSVLAADYLRSKKTTKSGNEKTQLKLKTALNLLVNGVGDRPCNEVTADDIVDFLERLQRLPSNANKIPALTGLSFDQLTDPAAPRGTPIADNTVNGHMTRVSGMFNWALSREKYLLRANPATGSVIKNPVASKRKPFTTEQLVALFSHESFQTRRFMHPHYYWLMPIAALSGMRLNEICQLQLADFQQVDGVDIISCADLEEGRKGKNENARRRVPIHDELKRLGLLRWVENLRAAGEAQLFPELKQGRDGHGQAPSKWFQGYRAACGIGGKQVYVFHSFRHYFIRRCLAAREMVQNIAAVVGHETDIITIDIYGQEFDMGILKEAVNKVALPTEVISLIPTIEECTFTKKPIRKPPPSRLGARKSREKRIEDAKARRAKLGRA